MKKAYLFCTTHALPTAHLMVADGSVVQAHAGENANDAIAWFNQFKKGNGYDVEVIDQELIEQVLINLVKNASQALPEIDGKIKISASLNRFGRVTIQVADNGQGITPDAIDKIFIPFFTTKTDGSGIGLSLSRQILRLHGGTITVRSTPDVETVFTLRF